MRRDTILYFIACCFLIIMLLCKLAILMGHQENFLICGLSFIACALSGQNGQTFDKQGWQQWNKQPVRVKQATVPLILKGNKISEWSK